MSRQYIDKFYEDYSALHRYLLERNEPSFAIEIGNNFRKSLVLAIASYFEHAICDVIRTMTSTHASGNVLLTSLVEAKAVSRQYHAYFDWDSPSANKFFGCFGEACKADFLARQKAEPDFKASTQAFLELGQTRNRLVHRNYVQFDVDKTPEEIYGQFTIALPFLEYVSRTLIGTVDPNR